MGQLPSDIGRGRRCHITQFLLFIPLLLPTSSSLLQQSFLSPLNDANTAASQVILSYASAFHHPEQEQEEILSSPSELLAAPSDIVSDYAYPDNTENENIVISEVLYPVIDSVNTDRN